VDFDVAMRRTKAYVREERLAVERLGCRRGHDSDLGSHSRGLAARREESRE
jgi:hypothetical protein